MPVDEFANDTTLSTVRHVAKRIAPFVVRTPTIAWPVPAAICGPVGDWWVKLELMQRTGSFKPRGAINTIQRMMAEADSASDFPGVTAFSAGNHAIAVAYAAHCLGTSAKVVMPRTANAFRMERVRAYGAELVLGDTISDLMQIVESIQQNEGRMLVHPFENIGTVQGTATVGLELVEDVADLDAVIVPLGGGGLIAGIASAVKQMQPDCSIIGVEPDGAQGMVQSLAQGHAMEKVAVNTIADSLGAPMHGPITFDLIQRLVDQVVTVSDENMREAMRVMFADLKLAVEPACAASLAALQGPLADQLEGRRVALVACGSNIDASSYTQLLSR